MAVEINNQDSALARPSSAEEVITCLVAWAARLATAPSKIQRWIVYGIESGIQVALYWNLQARVYRDSRLPETDYAKLRISGIMK